MKIRPLPGYILLELDKEDKTSESGLILSAHDVESNQGKVIAVGNKWITADGEYLCPVKVGERVMYKKEYADDIEGKKIIRFIDLIAVIDE